MQSKEREGSEVSPPASGTLAGLIFPSGILLRCLQNTLNINFQTCFDPLHVMVKEPNQKVILDTLMIA